MKRLLIFPIIFLILILTACASTPTATNAPSETPGLTATNTPTLVPTSTPEGPKFNIVKSPEAVNIDTITLADLQSGNLAKFEHSLDGKIDTDPSRIDFIYWENEISNTIALETNKKDGAPFESVKAAGFTSFYKTSLEPWGFDKDGYIASYSYIDKSDKETKFHIILTEKQLQHLLEKNFLNDPSAKLVPLDKLSITGTNFYYSGMEDLNKILYSIQGYSIEDIQDIFKRVAESDVISESDRKIIESLLFHGIPAFTNKN